MQLSWPWPRPSQRSPDCLVYCLGPDRLDWVTGRAEGARARLTGQGRLPRGTLDAAGWQRALRNIGMPRCAAASVLAPESYQLLQIEAPAVPADELRAAARWRIKDLIDRHVDDLTLDVLRLGLPASQVQGQPQMLVVASPNTEIAAAAAVASDAGWRLSTIDVADLAQRNLQSAAAATLDLEERATACLVQHGSLGLLTICAGGELFYTRRLEWDADLTARVSRPAPTAPSRADSAFAFQSTELTGFATELSSDSPPRLLTELQRSFDVWERSWPDLPLSLLMLHMEGDSATVADYLQVSLGIRVVPLDLAAELNGLAGDFAVTPAPALLGTLLYLTGVRT